MQQARKLLSRKTSLKKGERVESPRNSSHFDIFLITIIKRFLYHDHLRGRHWFSCHKLELPQNCSYCHEKIFGLSALLLLSMLARRKGLCLLHQYSDSGGFFGKTKYSKSFYINYTSLALRLLRCFDVGCFVHQCGT